MMLVTIFLQHTLLQQPCCPLDEFWQWLETHTHQCMLAIDCCA